MPNYDFKCKSCGLEVEKYCKIRSRKRQKCSCGGKLQLRFTKRSWGFRVRVWNDVGPRPFKATSPKQFKKYLDAHDLALK